MPNRTPPPGQDKGIMIAIGVPKRDGGAKGGAPERQNPPGTDETWGGQKVSGEEAGLVLEGEHCIDCTMYHPDTGECDKVEGSLATADGCAKYFDPIEGKEPDADDQGGQPDNDADDQPVQSPQGP